MTPFQLTIGLPNGDRSSTVQVASSAATAALAFLLNSHNGARVLRAERI